jgi:hypothetical protein
MLVAMTRRTVFWTNLDEPGSERAVFEQTDEGWLLRGTYLIQLETATEVHYEVHLDASWVTQAALVMVEDGDGERTVELVQVDGIWYRDGELLVLGPGCLDVDIALSPSTNTLPIRRLGLEVGASADVATAWLRIPDLTVGRSEQRYERISEHTYRFSDDDFVAELEVDDFGVVTHYEGGWRAESVVED